MQHKATIFYEWEQGKSAYSFPFPYLSKQFVKVRVDHANASTLLEYNRDYTIEGQTLTLTPVHPFVSGATLCIYRQTPTGSLADFSDGSLLLASELDRFVTQLLHIEEENRDLIASTGMVMDDNAWQGQGRRIKNIATPMQDGDAVTLKYLDSIDVARQSTLLQIEAAVTEKANQAAESARKSEEVVAQSSNHFNLLIETRFQNLTSLLMQKLSAEYVPQTQASMEHQELRTAILNAGIAILQRSKTYAVGDIVYHKSLPSWARLECVTAGTTGSNANVLLEKAKAGQYIIDGGVRWIVDDVRDCTPIGDVRGSLYLPDGYIKANGATVNRADYPRLVALADKHNLWTDDVTANAGLFGRGDSVATMVLPNWIDRMVQFANGAGASVAAGLPNITGAINSGTAAFEYPSASGAFSTGGLDRKGSNIRGAENVYSPNFAFNASRSNSIYGRSNTVQPAAIQLIPIIKY